MLLRREDAVWRMGREGKKLHFNFFLFVIFIIVCVCVKCSKMPVLPFVCYQQFFLPLLLPDIFLHSPVIHGRVGSRAVASLENSSAQMYFCSSHRFLPELFFGAHAI